MKKLILLAILAVASLGSSTFAYSGYLYLDGLWLDQPYYRSKTINKPGYCCVDYRISASGCPGAPYYVKMFSFAQIWAYDYDGSSVGWDKVYNSESGTPIEHYGSFTATYRYPLSRIKIAVSSERIFCEDQVWNAIAFAIAVW